MPTLIHLADALALPVGEISDICSLGCSNPKTKVDTLIAALRDCSEMVRGPAAFALGQIGDARAVGPLTAAIKNKEKHVGDAAAEALAQIRNRR